jgi:hypothetical protein
MVRYFSLAVILLALCAASLAQVSITVGFAPPALPIYGQPPCPADGYIWTPGYWAYDPDFGDYYWVPGTWVLAPEPGLLWTPPYWGWNGVAFVFYDGWWGPQVGFYGGIVYGFGYFGVGFDGGRWENGRFFYNRSVTNIDVTNIHNVYNTNVVNNTVVNHISYNGGEGGITARPTPQEEAAAHERRSGPVAAQTQHMAAARSNPELRASTNQGKPPIAATAKPGDFQGGGVVRAQEAGGPYHPPANRGGDNGRGNSPENNARANPAIHPNDLPPLQRPSDNTVDEKTQKEQQKLYAQQQKEREKLQQQQDKEHQKQAKQNASDAEKQQLEQRHQQQTQQLQQRQQAEQQRFPNRPMSPTRGEPPK